MKKLFTKILFIAVFLFSGQKQCFAVASYRRCAIGLAAVAGVVCGTIKLDRWWQSRFEVNYSQLYNIVLHECKKEVSVNESAARKIFKKNGFQQHAPNWYSVWTKVGFMEAFSAYCKNKAEFQYEHGVDKGNATKVLDMATTYLYYLKRPWVTKKDLIFIGFGVAVGTKLAPNWNMADLKLNFLGNFLELSFY